MVEPGILLTEDLGYKFRLSDSSIGLMNSVRL